MKINKLSDAENLRYSSLNLNKERQSYSYGYLTKGADTVSFSGKKTQKHLAGFLAALGFVSAINTVVKAETPREITPVHPYAVTDSAAGQHKFVVSPEILGEFFKGVDQKELNVSYWNNDEKGQNAIYSHTNENGEESRINYRLEDDKLKVTSRVFPNGDGTYTRIALDDSNDEFKEIFSLNQDGTENCIAKFSTNQYEAPSVVNDCTSAFDKADKYDIYDEPGNFIHGASDERGIIWVNNKPAYYSVILEGQTKQVNYHERNIFQFLKVHQDSTVNVGSRTFTFADVLGGYSDGVYNMGSTCESDIVLPEEDLNGAEYQIVKKGDICYISSKGNTDANMEVTASKSTSLQSAEDFDYTDAVITESQKQAMRNAINSGEYSKEELITIADLLTNNIMNIGKTQFIDEEYDKFNHILFGEPKDPVLRAELDSIGEEFGINIKIENDTVLYDHNGSLPEHFITTDYLQCIKDIFAQMRDRNQKLPNEVYLTRFFWSSSTFGEFRLENPDAIYMNIKGDVGQISQNIIETSKQIFSHEAAHASDYANLPPEIRKSDYDFLSNHKDVDIHDEKSLEKFGTSKDKIIQCMGNYATSNNQEFVAEVTSMIATEIIVQRPDGTYTINPDKVDFDTKQYANPRGMTDWTETEEQLAELNALMKVYDTLTDGLIVKPLVIGEE